VSTFRTAEAKIALRDMLRDRLGLENALVRLGRPPRNPREDEGIYLVGARNLRRASSERVTHESVTLIGIAWVAQTSKAAEPEEADARIDELLDEIVDTLATDPELGGIVDHAELTEVPTDDTYPTPEGWSGAATFGVTVTRAFYG
jgi:hypothetical protein